MTATITAIKSGTTRNGGLIMPDRLVTVWELAQVTAAVAAGDDYESLDDESLALVGDVASFLYDLTTALAARDTRAAVAADGLHGVPAAPPGIAVGAELDRLIAAAQAIAARHAEDAAA
jgi:hypothetical protein